MKSALIIIILLLGSVFFFQNIHDRTASESQKPIVLVDNSGADNPGLGKKISYSVSRDKIDNQTKIFTRLEAANNAEERRELWREILHSLPFLEKIQWLLFVEDLDFYTWKKEDIASILGICGVEQPFELMSWLLSEKRDSSVINTYCAIALNKWSERDPFAAWDWSVSNPLRSDPESDLTMMEIVLQNWILIYPEEALSVVENYSFSPSSSGADHSLDVYRNALQYLIDEGERDLAMASIEKLINEDFDRIDNSLIGVVASGYASNGLYDDAVEWILTLPQSNETRYALGEILYDWAAEKPEDALEWAIRIDASNASHAIDKAIGAWIEEDIVAASEWIDTQGESLIVDQAIWRLSSDTTLSDTDPDIAMSWAETIHDDQLRRQSVERIAYDWAKIDYESAVNYITESIVISSKDKDEILTLLERFDVEAK